MALPKWKRGLTKEERKHLHQVAKCTTLAAFKETVEYQEKRRKECPGPQYEPCWDCKSIARKLGLIDH